MAQLNRTRTVGPFKLPYRVVPLTEELLSDAISLIDDVFPYEQDQKLARITLKESLAGINSKKHYWIALGKDRKTLGITGLYIDHKDQYNSDTVWLGWFGVNPECRKLVFGRQ